MRSSVVFVGLVSLLFAALAASAPAQRQFEASLQKRYLPFDFDYTRAIAFGDVDGDADLDLVLGNSDYILGEGPPAITRLYRNSGTGRFTDVTTEQLPMNVDDVTQDVALSDVDGDGDLDLVVGNGGQSFLYLNDGTGKYRDVTASQMPANATSTAALALGDVDGDADVDILLGNYRQSALYLNDGSGTFTDATLTHLPLASYTTLAAVLVDVDGDGDLDAVLGNYGEQNRLYLNDGSGTFVDGTATRLPVDADSTTDLALADVDGDGDPDLVVGNSGAVPEQNRLYLNDGTGTFTDATAQLPAFADATSALAVGDVDGDSDPDLLIGNANAQDRLLLNDGTGVFADATQRLPFDAEPTSAVALLDVDGDADLDAVCATSFRQTRLYLNDGRAAFYDATAPRIARSPGSFGIDIADVDGDSDLDLVTAKWVYQNGLLLNDGTGTFTDATSGRMPPDSDISLAVVLGDVDGDLDPDVVFGNDGQNRLYLNAGAGFFADATAARLPAVEDRTAAVVLVDVDGDSDLDLVVGNHREQNRLYLNDGTGTFTDGTASRLPVDSDATMSLAAGDVDGDSDPDLVLGNDSQRNRLYLNDGTGAFTDATLTRLPRDTDSTFAVALGDVDADGDLDLVLGNRFAQNRLYLNDGSGTFSDATAGRMPVDRDTTVALKLVSIDGDRDLDLVIANSTFPHPQNRLYLNEGPGTFRDVTESRMPFDHFATQALAVGDVDRDGDADIVFAEGLAETLYVNLHKHLSASSFAVWSRELEVELHAKPGYGAFAHTGVVFLGLGLAPTPIELPPLGTFFLNPSPLAALPGVTIRPPAGSAGFSIPIPAVPRLLGVELYLQALVANQAHVTDQHLTGYTVDTIRR